MTLKSSEGKEFSFLTDQYSIEIVSCCLRLMPSCSSIHHQTNTESTQICSENHLLVSRIQSPHPLLEVILRVEEECLFFLPLGTLDRIELLVQYQSMFFQEYESCVLALYRLANENTSVFVVEVSCSLSSYFLSIKSVTNLFKP